MVAALVLALVLNAPIEPRLAVHLSIDQSGGLSAAQLELVVEELRRIWSDARVAVTSGRYGEPCAPDQATISLRIMLTLLPVKNEAERTLGWVTPGANGRSAPLLLISLPAVTEAVLTTEAFDLPVKRLPRGLRDRLIAQAIGRVTAHELGHYLLQRTGHFNRGLMRRKYVAVELVGDWLDPFRIPNGELLVVRQEIEALARRQASIEQ